MPKKAKKKGKYKPPRFLKKHRPQAILAHLNCDIRARRGKGAHWSATRMTARGLIAYTFGDHREYGHDYINGVRRALELTSKDGVSDRAFYEA